MLKPHKNHTKTFEELTFAEQAKSINAQIMNLKNQIIAHKRKATDDNKPTNDYIKPILKMLLSI